MPMGEQYKYEVVTDYSTAYFETEHDAIAGFLIAHRYQFPDELSPDVAEITFFIQNQDNHCFERYPLCIARI